MKCHLPPYSSAIFLFGILILASCSEKKKIIPGTSLELAIERKNSISNLHYDLSFDIPLERKDSIPARVTIAFDLKNTAPVLQLDFNGGESISNTVEAILLKGQDQMIGGFFPNPSNGNVNLWMSLNKDLPFSMEIVDALGQVVHSESRDVYSGYQKLDFNFSRLSKGSYIAHVKLGTETVIRKLVIQ